ncbi:CPXV058 protein [Cowpox virus]|uniref:CPXV058 protein n=1 Tax=Cowpox virus TaxID=10243 RepID=A0A290G7F8_COWPX|nr:CPXV058 protein [Cowpox virus]ATB55320.1 CPXV058 protein [Cowpox virus]ATB55535.1 CPXV058 protein [Cowpox virus]ATB55749.1 CPXV058 protein [Cowpox virus]ATB55964.1 CPXV058 protein [Cowpox virus]
MNHWQHPFIVQKAPIYKRKSRFDRDKLLTILSLFLTPPQFLISLVMKLFTISVSSLSTRDFTNLITFVVSFNRVVIFVCVILISF